MIILENYCNLQPTEESKNMSVFMKTGCIWIVSLLKSALLAEVPLRLNTYIFVILPTLIFLLSPVSLFTLPTLCT